MCAAVVLVLVAVRWWSGDDANSPPASYLGGGLRPGIYHVERVVDGDTIVLRGVPERLRLQGIDTPETVKEDTPVQPWGPEATAFTKAFVAEAGGRLRVEVDGEPRDRHGRYLAFVWHEHRMLNEELLQEGFARTLLQFDYGSAKKSRFRKAQRAAQKAERGIWSKSDAAVGVQRTDPASAGAPPDGSL